MDLCICSSGLSLRYGQSRLRYTFLCSACNEIGKDSDIPQSNVLVSLDLTNVLIDHRHAR